MSNSTDNSLVEAINATLKGVVLDDMIVSLYADGMTVRDIWHLYRCGLEREHDLAKSPARRVLPCNFSSTRYTRKSEMATEWSIRSAACRSALVSTASSASWDCGSLKMKAPQFGYQSAQIWPTVVSRTCSSCAATGSKACRKPWRQPSRSSWCRPASCT